jgi:hypothetical protein
MPLFSNDTLNSVSFLMVISGRTGGKIPDLLLAVIKG